MKWTIPPTLLWTALQMGWPSVAALHRIRITAGLRCRSVTSENEHGLTVPIPNKGLAWKSMALEEHLLSVPVNRIKLDVSNTVFWASLPSKLTTTGTIPSCQQFAQVRVQPDKTLCHQQKKIVWKTVSELWSHKIKILKIPFTPTPPSELLISYAHETLRGSLFLPMKSRGRENA